MIESNNVKVPLLKIAEPLPLLGDDESEITLFSISTEPKLKIPAPKVLVDLVIIVFFIINVPLLKIVPPSE